MWLSLVALAACTRRLSTARAGAGVEQLEPNATSYFLSGYPLAVCLDGTPGAYQLRAGAEGAKYLVFHEGGGACFSLEDCTARAATPLGSSATYARGVGPLPTTYGVPFPFFSTDPLSNPLFHNWTHVYVKYVCILSVTPVPPSHRTPAGLAECVNQ